MELWAESLNLHHLLAECIPISKTITSSTDFLRFIGDLKEQDIDAVAIAFQDSLKCLLRNAVSRLKNAFREMDKLRDGLDASSSKYSAFQMSGGQCSDFHRGIFGRVGMLSIPSPAMCFCI